MTARNVVRTALLVAVVLAILVSAPAQAATVSMVQPFGLQTLSYRAEPGEVNRLTVSSSGGGVLLTDPAGITPGEGCSRPVATVATTVVCPLPRFLTGVPLAVTLGDGDDVIVTELPAVVDTAEISGNEGNDLIRGSSGEDRLDGGPGRDELFGFARDDTFMTLNLDGPDTMHGGDGIGDLADYSGRTARLRLDLDGRADDGQAGEGDRLDIDVEDMTGGSAADRITSFSQPTTMSGGPGNDVMRGGASTDELFGNGGRDRLHSGSGSDKIEGGRGSDRIAGGRGSDLLRGEGGNDLIRSRDGRIDRVGCGTGRDRIVLDRLDMAFRSCERVARNGAAVLAPIGVEALPEGFAIFAAELEGRTIGIEIGCPRDHRRGCSGTFRLLRRGRLLATRGFSVRTDGRKTYEVVLPASVARAVRRRGRLGVRFVADSRDALGRGIRLTVPFRIYETLPTL
jgi:Ca2+-binding RTX toxin-like protein